MSRTCKHEERETVIEYHGIEVKKCTNCRHIFAINPVKAQLTLHNSPQAHLEAVRGEIRQCLDQIDLWIKKCVSGDKYTFWKDEVLGKVWWRFVIQKRGEYSHLMLKFVDPSMNRISHRESAKNTNTTRSFGNVNNFPDVDEVMDWQVKYLAWQKIETFLESVARAL
jgi:hypothetical protein